MSNFLLSFYGNRQGNFYLVVYAASWEAADSIGRAAAAEMGYGFDFRCVEQDMSNVC